MEAHRRGTLILSPEKKKKRLPGEGDNMWEASLRRHKEGSEYALMLFSILFLSG